MPPSNKEEEFRSMPATLPDPCRSSRDSPSAHGKRKVKHTNKSLALTTLALGAVVSACESGAPPLALRGLAESDAAVIAALDYVVKLERRTSVYQGDRAFELGESVFVEFKSQRPDGSKWSSAVEEVTAARGWKVVRDDPRICDLDTRDFHGEPICRLPSAEADGLLLVVYSVRHQPTPTLDPPWPGLPTNPTGTGGVVVDLRSLRNRLVPFDEDLYDEVLTTTFPEEPLERGSAVMVRRVTRDDALAAYDRVAAAASGAPGVLGACMA